MADALNPNLMGKKQNSRRNKSTSSLGSKKTRVLSTTSINLPKFQPSIDGHRAFLLSVAKLGKNGTEFTWHDIRKVYHKETNRNLTVEEMNNIFSTKNLTKRDMFEMPSVKKFLESMDGTMLCRFRLIPQALEEVMKRSIEAHDIEISNCSDCKIAASSSSVHSSTDDSTSDANADNSNEKSTAIEVLTDCEINVKSAPTSDLSKSESCDYVDRDGLHHQPSLQSSVTDDEGWVSGKEARSDNSSPLLVEENHDIGKCEIDEDDDVFETDTQSLSSASRIAAGSDEVDGVVGPTALVLEEKQICETYEAPKSPIVVTSSLEAAFEAVVKSYEDTSARIPVSTIEKVSENVKVQSQTTPKKLTSEDGNQLDTVEIGNGVTEARAEPAKIRQLIQKFDNPVTFAEVVHQKFEAPAQNTSIYAKVLKEIGDVEKSIEKVFSSPKSKENGIKKEILLNGETSDNGVIFRSLSTHSKVLMEGKVQLDEFVAEQEAKKSSKIEIKKDSGSEAGFAVKEQSSMSSLDREYFESKMCTSEDLFAELGVRDCDGFTPLRSASSPNAYPHDGTMQAAETSNSEGLVTVIERKPDSNVVDRDDSKTPKVREFQKIAKQDNESDADIPYSLCSEDEGEPMTMIDKSMKSHISHSAEQLKFPREGSVPKPKTVLVNVELESKKKSGRPSDVNILKKTVSPLKAVAPIAKTDSVDEPVAHHVHTLNRNEELETSVLEVKPLESAANSDGSMRVRRRQVRFIRGGCCVVM